MGRRVRREGLDVDEGDARGRVLPAPGEGCGQAECACADYGEALGFGHGARLDWTYCVVGVGVRGLVGNEVRRRSHNDGRGGAALSCVIPSEGNMEQSDIATRD